MDSCRMSSLSTMGITRIPERRRHQLTGVRLAPATIALLWAALGCTSLVCGQSTGNTEASIDFDRQVRPILSDNCFPCHGPDSGQRQADLRLDRRDAIPSHVLAPAMGELVRRIRSDDPDERMPPPSSHLSLTDDQQQLLATGLPKAPSSRSTGHSSRCPGQFRSPRRTTIAFATRSIALFLRA